MNSSKALDTANIQVRALLETHYASPEFGFLAENPVLTLSPMENFNNLYTEYFEALQTATDNLPNLIREKRITETLAHLPPISNYYFFRYISTRQQYWLMHMLGILTHSYFNETLEYETAGEVQKDSSIKILPAKLAKPLWLVAQEIKTVPSFSYMLYSLYNYDIPDKTKKISLKNIKLVHSFTGTRDEEWFVNIHQVIEKTVAPALTDLLIAAHFIELIDHKKEATDVVIVKMQDAVIALETTLAIFKRMREQCDYRTYFDSVRKFYIFPKNVVFEGVSETPKSFYGETGGQTPFMHTILSLLGMYPAHIPYFPEMRLYMSGHHRALVESTLAHWNIRSFVDLYGKKNPRLVRSYNALAQFVVDWRAEHFSLASDYIKEFGDTHGTGGTPLAWLERLHEHAKSFLIHPPPRRVIKK
ncbi:MAG: hypothetical protein HYT37_02145 [Candidatus Sungbacteria bacterium]|nr:hypothetical protein [Candidatus Sungbacteria bacterium]